MGVEADGSLQLRKELTQIRKAARLLKDPGTSSTPITTTIGSARSHSHYINHLQNHSTFLQDQEEECNDNFSMRNQRKEEEEEEEEEEEKLERKVFLCNWRAPKSDHASSSSSTPADDSKSDTCLSDIYATALSRFKAASFTPSISRTIKKNKPKRRTYSSDSSRDNYRERLRLQELLSRYAATNDSPCLSYADQSDDLGTEDCLNSEDLARASSPLLARLKNKGWTPPLSSSSMSRAKLLSRLRNRNRNPTSTVGSWDATTGEASDGVEDDNLDLPQGCGIPCYWSRRSTPKSRNGSSCSPSLSDTLRRTGTLILCRTQAQKGHYKKRLRNTTSQTLVPLLTNTAHRPGESVTASGNSGDDDEVSTNLGELDLEALNRLDGKRWSSSCRSQDGLELVHYEEGSPDNVRSLSHKYRPMFFEEVIGQNIVVQSLTTAVARKRIAPVYLFHGPRGTGKTSAARIFAAALNCSASDETKPCGVCRECTDFLSGKSSCLGEVDGSNKKGIEKIKHYLRSISLSRASVISQYKVFVVEECHLLPSKTWLALLRLLDKPMPRIVFVLITSDIDNVPRGVLSRCQKHLFNKIGNGDIVNRLRKISAAEKFDVESSALELVASNANGSLRDAETMLDQLSLFGKRITKSLVNELIGVVSDEKLLELLELALSSNAADTVMTARELMDSGVDPILLMSQLVNLIVDIIAGTHYDSLGGRSLTDRELESLKHALTILSQAEKHLGVSSDRSTWFTATLLQLGSVPSPDQAHIMTSQRQSLRATEEDSISIPREARRAGARLGSPTSFLVDSHPDSFSKGNAVSLSDAVRFRFNNQSPCAKKGVAQDQTTVLRCIDSKTLKDIWLECIEKCHSKTLRQLLLSSGKLISISETKGGFVAHIAFGDSNIKTRAQGFLSSITNSFEAVLQYNVEVRMILLQDSFCQKLIDKNSVNLESRSKGTNVTADDSNLTTRQDQFKAPIGCFNLSENPRTKSLDTGKDIPLRRIESIIHEQRLETAWLQAMEKGTPGSMSHLRPDRNQVLPQEGMDVHGLETVSSVDVPIQHWEDELNREINALRINDDMAHDRKEQSVKTIDHYPPISPSLLHSNNLSGNFTKDNTGYDSGSGSGGCSAMFCWKNTRTKRRPKAKQGTAVYQCKGERFSSWFGACARSTADNRYNR